MAAACAARGMACDVWLPPCPQVFGKWREVLPHAPDAWIDDEKSKVGYEIPFNRHFYVFEPPRSLHAIDEELKEVSARIVAMLGELAE